MNVLAAVVPQLVDGELEEGERELPVGLVLERDDQGGPFGFVMAAYLLVFPGQSKPRSKLSMKHRPSRSTTCRAYSWLISRRLAMVR